MECIEARALKSSFLSELAMKSSQQVFFDDLLSVNGVNGVSGDEFSVDVFLDLSNENSEDGFVEEKSEGERDTPSVSENRVEDDNSYNSTTFSGCGDSGYLPAGELALPVDDLEHLEWLSQFVDDSVSELSLLCPAGDLKEITGNRSVNRTELVSRPVVHKISPLCFTSPVPAKARSKRSRPSGGRAWSRGSSSLSDSTSTSSSSPGSSPISVFTFSNLDMAYGVAKPPPKKHKKRPPPPAAAGDEASQMQRRCRHCHVQKTPQWRTGPLGPKTLCNACGVRYKSGRLLPEYRPACSPTFSVDVHSNSHRKVIEMRQKKELSGAKIGLLTGMVPSF